jgi:hypothetical protein
MIENIRESFLAQHLLYTKGVSCMGYFISLYHYVQKRKYINLVALIGVEEIVEEVWRLCDTLGSGPNDPGPESSHRHPTPRPLDLHNLNRFRHLYHYLIYSY